MQTIWLITVTLGPLIFIVTIIFVAIRNKMKSTPQSEALTERATKQQRETRAQAQAPEDRNSTRS